MDKRRCRFCGDDVESEWHVLLHCPILDLVRAQYPELDFSGTLQNLLAQSSCSKLVDYLLEVFHLLRWFYVLMVVGSSAMETHCNQCILSYPILLSCWHEVSSDIHDKLLCLQQVGNHDVHQALEIWFLTMLSMHLGHPMDDNVSSHFSCVALSTWNGQMLSIWPYFPSTNHHMWFLG